MLWLKIKNHKVTIIQVVLYNIPNYWFMSPFSHERDHIHEPVKACNDYWNLHPSPGFWWPSLIEGLRACGSVF